MTELEKASNSICGVHPDWSRLECFRIGFKEGAQWQAKQSPWISVKERLPDVGISVFVRTTNKKYVLTSMYIPTDCKGNILGPKEWHGSGVFKGSITHWMPIPNI